MGRATGRLTLAVLLLVMLLTLPGCDDASDVLQAALSYPAAVSQGMALRGWDGFPGTPLALADYIGDLRDSISDARKGVVTEGLGDGADVDENAVRGAGGGLRGLGEAFRVPGSGDR